MNAIPQSVMRWWTHNRQGVGAALHLPNPLSPGQEGLYIRAARFALIASIVLLFLFRFVHLTYDFPEELTKSGALYTDEGWYAGNAIVYTLEGHWYVEKGYNPAVNSPVLQFIQAACFAVFGFGITTLRVLTIAFTAGLAAAVYFLVRRFEGHWTAVLAAFFLSLNHLLFAYSRLSLAEIPMAFFLALAFLAGAYSRGRWGCLYAALAALAFSAALLTKTSALFAVPILGGVIAFQEREWKKILLKFVVCSAVFFACMGLYGVFIVRPRMTDFLYFHSLNVGLTSNASLSGIAQQFSKILSQTEGLEKTLIQISAPMTGLLLLLSPSYRRSPLLYLSISWYVLYVLMFSTYGRFLPRFFLPIVAPFGIWAAVTLKHLRGLGRDWWPLVYTFVFLLLLVVFWNVRRVVHYLAVADNSFAEMAEEIKDVMDADPESNGVLMGHLAPAISLRNGVIPRNDRYSPYPMKERLPLFQPSYYVSEGVVRLYPLEPYYEHREWMERYYKMEFIQTFEVFENYRGYPVAFYKLYPRPEMWGELE